MPDEIYRHLAERLDAMPNGFPPTESGVELRLLEKLFSPEEAFLASQMRLSWESATAISSRAGVSADAAHARLKKMARRGLIYAKRGEAELLFRLMPFVVGFYEEQLPRLDEELAQLTEDYFLETRGASITQATPAFHRVIPVETSIPFELEIFPYERGSQLLENAKAWGVRDCICRVQQRLIGAGCDYPVENCLVFAPVEGAFDHSDVTRAISKSDALRILDEASAAGLIHSTGNYREPHYYICNCCTCCCGILRGVAEFGVPTAIAKSDFQASVYRDECTGCGNCVSWCQFGALSIEEDGCVVDSVRCVGCGVCAGTCPTEALFLHRRTEEEIIPPPIDIKEWGSQRAKERGIDPLDIP